MKSTPDNIKLLFEPDVTGTNFFLDIQNPNAIDADHFEASERPVENAGETIPYITVAGQRIQYADGTPDGLTIRLYIKSPGRPKYTWRDGAREHGFIGSEKDFKNIEATIYVRFRDYNNTHTSISWIIRGGLHTGAHDPRSSCVGMQVPYGGLQASAFKELDHPDYDFIKIGRNFDYSVKENEWVAIKIISFLEKDASRTKNFLYLDTDPYDDTGKPNNNFRLYSEWVDQDGISTGKYTVAALWAGWVTTFRVDGWKNVDVAHLSAYEIIPPAG